MDLLSRFGVVASVPTGYNGPDGTNYYVPITIQASEVSSALTDFPVYVDLSTMPSDFWANVQSDGGDIRVTTSDGVTRVPVELVSIDTSGETGELHFLATSVSSVSDTEFRLFYDAETTLSQPSVTDTYGRNAVWTDYDSVYHLAGDPTVTAIDSAGTYDETPFGMGSSDLVTGKLGDGYNFGGDPASVPNGDNPSDHGSWGSQHTVSAWVKPNANSDSGVIVSNRQKSSGDPISWIERTNSDNNNVARFLFRDNSAAGVVANGSPMTPGTWFHLVGYRDGNNVGLFQNTSKYTASALLGPTTQDAFVIGANYRGVQKGTRYFEGVIDEVRVRQDVLNDAWVSAEYVNQDAPALFYSVGTQTQA